MEFAPTSFKQRSDKQTQQVALKVLQTQTQVKPFWGSGSE
jgi:hypothetical protein